MGGPAVAHGVDEVGAFGDGFEVVDLAGAAVAAYVAGACVPVDDGLGERGPAPAGGGPDAHSATVAGMSLSDEWARSLGDVELSYLYRICSRAIEEDEREGRCSRLRSKGEQDVAWAVKQEFEDRRSRQAEDAPGVWLTQEKRRLARLSRASRGSAGVPGGINRFPVL